MSTRMAFRTILGLVVTLPALTGVAEGATAGTPDSTVSPPRRVLDAFTRGSLSINLRYRFELVDDAVFSTNAYASTIRSALDYETASFHGLFAGVTLENVTALGDDWYDNRGSGRLDNGVRDRPAVADPAMTEVHRAYLGFRGPLGVELQAGRRELTFDNQRFVGIAPWRQNHRSYDAASAAIGTPRTVTAQYTYLHRVNYNTGARPRLAGHLLQASRTLGPVGVSAYAYLLDWRDTTRAALSSGTYGLRVEGTAPIGAFDALYFAEYARQTDFGNNPTDFALDYVHLGLGARRGAWSLRGAWEMKGGDGTSAVQTPLGTNHGKNGFADRLVQTPPEGSHDLYVRLAMDRSRWAWLLDVHQFQAVQGGAILGRELDAQARFTPARGFSLFLKLAVYQAEAYSVDVTKAMAWASFTLPVLPGS